MAPETKFALLMVGLMLLFPASVIAVHVLHRALVHGVTVRLRPLVLVGVMAFSSGAYGQEVTPQYVALQWQGDVTGALSPSAFCSQLYANGARLVARVWLGFPVQFVCAGVDGTAVNQNVYVTTASCPSGYHVDLPMQLCVLDPVDSAGGDGSVSSLRDMTPSDAAQYGSMILFLWACAWAVKAVMDVVRETGSPPDET